MGEKDRGWTHGCVVIDECDEVALGAFASLSPPEPALRAGG